MTGRPDDGLPEDLVALVTAARRKAAALPDEGEVAHLVRRAMDCPGDLNASEIAHLGDVAGRQAHQVSALLRRLADLVEGESAPGNHGQP